MKKNILIIVLAILLCGSSTYILYNKYLEYQEKETEPTVTKNNSIQEDLVYNYTEDSYETYSKEDNKTVTSSSSITKISVESTNHKELAKKLTSNLEKIIDEKWDNEVKKQADEYNEGDTSSDIVGVKIEFSIVTSSEKYITFKETTTGSFGGTSWNEIKTYNYSLETGELLTIKDIAEDYDTFTTTVYNYLVNKISENTEYSNYLNNNWQEELKTILIENGNWGFATNSITYQLPKYSIGVGALGVLEFDIPTMTIDEYLKEDYRGS